MHNRRFPAAPTGEVGAIGLGCMGMSWAYGASQRDDATSVAVIREALDAGVTLLDTAQLYGDGANEALLGRALRGISERPTVATKTGLVVDDQAAYLSRRDGSPAHVRSSVEQSLRRLGVEAVDLYYLHRVDPEVPLEETWGAMAELVTAGKVRHLGLSEVSAEQAARAHAVHPVAAVQSELSLWTRDPLGPGEVGDVVGWCREHGAAFVPFSPLGRGFLTGTVRADQLEEGDGRRLMPRFGAEAQRRNLRIVDAVAAVAERCGATPAQVAIAWTLAQGEHVVPIPGTTKPHRLRENLAAADLELTAADLAELDALPAPVGERY